MTGKEKSTAVIEDSNKSFVEMPHVLIIDDDKRICALVSRYLQEHGFIVHTAESAAEAREVLRVLEFDVLVVDIMMPGESGLEFTRFLRQSGNDIPVLLLTALGDSQDRITGLESGADDYLPKPFEPRELILRLQAILRRRPQVQKIPETLKLGRWIYSPEHNELRDNAAGEVLRLTTVEGNLLQALAGQTGQVISREDLAVICDMEGSDRTIDVQVTRLRRKIEDDSKMPRYLQTVRGKGYLLRVDS